MAGIAPSTIRLYATDYQEFLSDGANPGHGETRKFTREDIAIFRTVKALRDQGFTTEEIKNTLERGERYEPLNEPTTNYNEPQGETIPPYENLANVALDLVKGQVDALTNERNYLREQLQEERTARIDAEKRATAAETEARILREQKSGIIETPEGYEQTEKRKSWWERLTGK